MIKLTGSTISELVTALNGMTEDQKDRCVIRAKINHGGGSSYTYNFRRVVCPNSAYNGERYNSVLELDDGITWVLNILIVDGVGSCLLTRDNLSAPITATIMSWQILYQDDSVSGGNTYPASQVTLESGGTVEDRFDANTLGGFVNILTYTESNQYTFSSDGYVMIRAAGNSSYISLKINATMVLLARQGASDYQILYVKKGMKCYTFGSSGTVESYFYPLR